METEGEIRLVLFPAVISWCRQQKCNPPSENQCSLHVLCTESGHTLNLTLPCIKHILHGAINCTVHFYLSKCFHTLGGFPAWALQEELGVPAVRSHRQAPYSSSRWTDKSNIQRYWTNGKSTQTELTVWGESQAKINTNTSRSECWQCSKGTNHPWDWIHFHLIYSGTFHTFLTWDSDRGSCAQLPPSEQVAVNSLHTKWVKLNKWVWLHVIFEYMIAC